MARNRWVVANSVKQACVAATAITQLVINAPAGIREAITGIAVYFDGTSNVAVPVLVRLIGASTAGTTTAVTPRKLDRDIATALQLTAGELATVEPTKDQGIQCEALIHPQSGAQLMVPLPDGEIIIPGGGHVALEITAAANVNVLCEIIGEE